MSQDGATGRPCVKCGALPAFYIWIVYVDNPEKDLPLCAECGVARMKNKAPDTVVSGAEDSGAG